MLSYALLALAIIAYGLAGAQLTTGSRAVGGALHSRAWWLGTGLQSAGFLLTFFARHDLPLLLVQAGVVGALAVTAAIQHVRGAIRLSAGDLAAVIGIVGGLTLLGVGSNVGSAPAAVPGHLVALLMLLVPSATAGVRRWPPLASGLFSGLAFGVGAVAARLLVAQPGRFVGEVWRWTWADVMCAALVLLSLGLGQLNLTRGLAHGHPVAVLGSMYAASTVLPAVVGWAMLSERPRRGVEWVVLLAVVITTAAAARLVRLEGSTPRQTQRSQRRFRATKVTRSSKT